MVTVAYHTLRSLASVLDDVLRWRRTMEHNGTHWLIVGGEWFGHGRLTVGSWLEANGSLLLAIVGYCWGIVVSRLGYGWGGDSI